MHSLNEANTEDLATVIKMAVKITGGTTEKADKNFTDVYEADRKKLKKLIATLKSDSKWTYKKNGDYESFETPSIRGVIAISYNFAEEDEYDGIGIDYEISDELRKKKKTTRAPKKRNPHDDPTYFD